MREQAKLPRNINISDTGNYSLMLNNACGTYSDSLFLSVHENAFEFPFDSLCPDPNPRSKRELGLHRYRHVGTCE
ncbi:MAG: hypothetical protein U9R19_11920, partial [Bacteroidota bacterium]|nr:hypothetical protein [Bacteroidota bacterium]